MKKITLIMACLGMFVLLNAQIPSVLTEADFSTKSGTVTDERDGKTYAYKQYGDYYWFMQNLNWDGTINGEGNEKGKTAPDDADGGKFGRYYTTGEYTDGLCPEGWSITSYATNSPNSPWQVLFQNIASEYGLPASSTVNNYDTKNFTKYLKAGGVEEDGGLWKLGTIDTEIASQIQFNVLPTGEFNGNYTAGKGIGMTAYFLLGGNNRYYFGENTSPGHQNYFENIRHAGGGTAMGNVRCIKKVLPADEAALKTANTDYSTAKDYLDPRPEADGKTYKIKEFNGKEWFVENLNYPALDAVTVFADANGDVYGRLYPAGAETEKKNSWCPIGWRVSTTEDWDDLLTYLGTTYTLNEAQLASALIAGGAGSDYALWLSDAFAENDDNRALIGFNALPASYVKQSNGNTNFLKYYYPLGNGRGTSAHFIQDGVSHRFISNASAVSSGDFEGTFASVRCVREKTNKEPQLIVFSIPAKTNVGDEFQINLNSSADLPIIYNISDAGVAEITGNTLKIKAEGTVTITANQAGNELYNAAVEITQTTTAYPTPEGLESWTGCPADLLKKDFSTADGIFTDSRDQKQYAYKDFGDFYWFMQNLNWDGNGNGYDEATNKDGKRFGRFYSTYDAINNPICPEGWMVARYEEWRNLSDYLQETYELDIVCRDGYRFNNLLKYVKSVDMEVEGGLWKVGNIDTLKVNEIQFNMLPSGASNGSDIGNQAHYVMGRRSHEDRFYTGTNTNPTHQDYVDHFRHASGGTGNVRCVKSTKQEQTITFPDFPEFRVGDADMDPGAAASSELAVSYESSDEEIAVIVDNKIHAVKAGTVMITAKQAGNEVYQAAPDVRKQLVILPQLDNEPPTKPENLRSADVTMTSATISWDESQDNVEVAGYNIYKDGGFLASIPAATMTLTDLTPGTTYIIEIAAYDEAGNESEKADITITTLSPVGFEAYTLKSTVIYPNPVKAGGSVYAVNLPAELSENASIKLYNVSGQLLKAEKAVEGMAITVDAPGIYVIEIENQSDKGYFRLIVE